MAPVALSQTQVFIPHPVTMSPNNFKVPLYTPTPVSNGVVPPSPPAPSTSSSPPREVLDVPLRTEFAFDPMEEALDAFKRGEFLVVMDDEGRENEGDLIIAASECSTEKMAWMIKHTSYVSFDLFTLPLTSEANKYQIERVLAGISVYLYLKND